MEKLLEKYEKLIEKLKSYEKAAIAFSAGVDSTFLLKAAKQALGENVIAITGRLVSFPDKEFAEAEDFCRENGISHVYADLDQMSIPGFSDNPIDRCYICKKALFTRFLEIASENGCAVLAEGSNADDITDYRPGLKALSELEIKSPLKDCGLTKAEIRELSKKLDLPTWNKPSMACLATRFPYSEKLTEEKIRMVGEAEDYLSEMGFKQVRVRYHGEIARIETDRALFEKLLKPEIMDDISSKLHLLGFRYVTLDLDGYVTGSMNPAEVNPHHSL